MGAPTIRPATPSDAEALARAWLDGARHFAQIDPSAFRLPREEGLVEWLRSTVPDEKDDTEAVLVAQRDGGVVGFVAARLLEPDPTAAWQMQRELGLRRVAIDAVTVVATERGRGAGTALVRAAEAWGRARGAQVAVLDANWASGVATGFYEDRLGYERRGLNLRRSLGDPGSPEPDVSQ